MEREIIIYTQIETDRDREGRKNGERMVRRERGR